MRPGLTHVAWSLVTASSPPAVAHRRAPSGRMTFGVGASARLAAPSPVAVVRRLVGAAEMTTTLSPCLTRPSPRASWPQVSAELAGRAQRRHDLRAHYPPSTPRPRPRGDHHGPPVQHALEAPRARFPDVLRHDATARTRWAALRPRGSSVPLRCGDPRGRRDKSFRSGRDEQRAASPAPPVVVMDVDAPAPGPPPTAATVDPGGRGLVAPRDGRRGRSPAASGMPTCAAGGPNPAGVVATRATSLSHSA